MTVPIPAMSTPPSPHAPTVPLPSVSIVVPTFREAENIPHLLARIAALRETRSLELEVLFMDDNSGDGSVEAVQAFGADWARIVVRTEDPGLSPAVVDGLKHAKKDFICVMDADLSHPPEKIPDMLVTLQAGFQFVIGSRYVEGGSTDDDWGFFRWLNSRVATLLALPLTRVKDPMAGFFAMRRADLARAPYLNPVGYKIGLELIVKCRFDNVVEVPIHFVDREFGDSKLTLIQQLRYLQHLRRLYTFKFGTWSHLLQFMVVGASGVFVNLGVLTALLFAGASEAIAVAGGIVISVLTNFGLNRRFTFDYARHGNVWKQLFGFVLASVVGGSIQWAVTMATTAQWPQVPIQAAALVGIGAGMVFNFLANRFVVFRKEHVRPKPEGGVLASTASGSEAATEPKARPSVRSPTDGHEATLPQRADP